MLNLIMFIIQEHGINTRIVFILEENGYKQLYIKLTPNDITGEHSCIMIKQIREGKVNKQLMILQLI